MIHSRPYHPQSRGKNERFHRTLKAEVFALKRFGARAEVQRALKLAPNYSEAKQLLEHLPKPKSSGGAQ